MAKKNKKQQQEVVPQRRTGFKTGWIIVNSCGPVPIAPPAKNIQLTPIVQPLAMVPYSTQEQSMYAIGPDGEDY